MTFKKHTFLAILAVIAFLLFFQVPDSAWMDNKSDLVYYGSYVLGGLIGVFVLYSFYKSVTKSNDSDEK